MNTACFSGYLGRSAEVKETNSGSVTNFSVAVKIGWGDKERTLWVGCAMWGDRGEKVAPYLTKGTPVTVSGDVDLRQFDKKDGTPGAEITLNVQRLTLQGRGSERSDDSPRPAAATAAAGGRTSAQVAADADFPEFDDDKTVPF